jgi:hypothetical protein
MRERRARKQREAEIEKHRLTEHQLAKQNEKDLISSITETNKLPKLPWEPSELKEFGHDIGKPLKQSFFEDKSTPEPTELDCIEIQRKLKNYEPLSMAQKAHISNCDSCSLCYSQYGRGLGVKSLW